MNLEFAIRSTDAVMLNLFQHLPTQTLKQVQGDAFGNGAVPPFKGGGLNAQFTERFRTGDSIHHS